MSCRQNRVRTYRRAIRWRNAGRIPALIVEPAALLLAAGAPLAMHAQQVATAAKSLVFDRVTIVDVEQGKLVPDQRVVITGNRIQAIGGVGIIKAPPGAQLVDARGKYLMPGLWDMHVHPFEARAIFYPLFLAYGVTGIRDAGSRTPLDSLLHERREILAGTRPGPPRQLLSGPQVSAKPETCIGLCLDGDSASARRLVDSLKAAGADIVKTYLLPSDIFFVIAAEARRVGLPFGGHLEVDAPTAIEASDSGMGIVDHPDASGGTGPACWGRAVAWQEYSTPGARSGPGTIEECRRIAEHFKRNGTWWCLTLSGYMSWGPWQSLETPRIARVFKRFRDRVYTFWSDSAFPGAARLDDPAFSATDTLDAALTTSLPPGPPLLRLLHDVGFPIVAGTDVVNSWMAPMDVREPRDRQIGLPGLMLHAELAMYVAEGLTPLEALQSATLNPAKFLHGTDSLGTVAPGKLADLVLLDADPLADIANTQTIRAVIANGRYFDRTALDRLLADARATAKQQP